MPRRAAAVTGPSLLLAAALLTGCGDDTRTTSSSSGTTSTIASPSSGATATTAPAASTPDVEDGEGAASGTPPFAADTQPDTQEPSADARVTVTEIRTGRQDGFDRVVLEVEGVGTPGWDVRYVDRASSQGSGELVEVAGEAVLQVTLTGVGYPYDTGVEEWTGPDPLPGNGTRVVTEVAWDATFEGTSVAFIGTTAQVPFRVSALDDPTRVVVDVLG
ncbi:hypothetical protein DQ238_07005 [Geodermatophilus sp. TF02-6]|uniref:AMIN-like domain-containing (lipo)protein n=1 Tax=Geodermatophilus sp. TF02-6 TaxID=2250575 RepID=UPI000DEB0E44|nr:hypothetical protein [Geodermatophilus sp. TF02-6]RBY81751.1 hypothetical protein DQ238_07005 [Geodermatophilus sp. TF02-6]